MRESVSLKSSATNYSQHVIIGSAAANSTPETVPGGTLVDYGASPPLPPPSSANHHVEPAEENKEILLAQDRPLTSAQGIKSMIFFFLVFC